MGLKGAGKTELAKHILRQEPNHMVYDPIGEYNEFRNYMPDDRFDPEESTYFVEEFVLKERPRLVIFDEANAYTSPKPRPLPRGIRHLVDFSRHEGITFGVIARRPVQLHTDLVELSQFYFVFNLHGRNDITALNNTYVGMGETVRGLEQFHFAILEEGRNLTVHEPIPIIEHKI